MISAIGSFIFKIGNSRIIENILAEKISYDLRKFNHFKKLVKREKILLQKTLLKVLFF